MYFEIFQWTSGFRGLKKIGCVQGRGVVILGCPGFEALPSDQFNTFGGFHESFQVKIN
jgi:hypothetical protein